MAGIEQSNYKISFAMGEESRLITPGTNMLSTQPGTIYVATDTHKLYVDLIDGARVSIKAPVADKVANKLTVKVNGNTTVKEFDGSGAQTINFSADTGINISQENGTIKIKNTHTIPTTLKNPYSLTWGSKTYDGSAAREITLEDFGITNVLDFLGSSTDTKLVDGYTNATITVNGGSVTAVAGNIVLRDNVEYIWTGAAWEKLGDENLWVPNTRTITAGTGLTSDNSQLNQDITISHATYTCTPATSGDFVTSITDDNGHVTAWTKSSFSSVLKKLTLKYGGANTKTYQPWDTDVTFDVPVMTGGTGSAQGKVGLVPAPSATDPITSFLTADAKWSSLAAGNGIGVSGLTIYNLGVTGVAAAANKNGYISVVKGSDASNNATGTEVKVYELPAATSAVLGGTYGYTGLTLAADGKVSLTKTNITTLLEDADRTTDGYLTKENFIKFDDAYSAVTWGTF